MMDPWTLANQAEEFADSKIKELFTGKGYTEMDLSCLKTALEVGYIAGRAAEAKEIDARVDEIIMMQQTKGRVQ